MHGADERSNADTRLVRVVPAWHVATMRAAAFALVLVLGFPAAGSAHMVVMPERSEAGGWERYTILVPTEKPSPTVRVEVRLPAGMDVIAVESKAGWTGTYEPFPIGESKVAWKGGRIPTGEFLSFEFLAWNPPAPRVVTWEATQWHEDGTSERWTGDHASTTTLKAGSGGQRSMHRHREGAPPKSGAAAPH
jgi:uncharacterized protein YcnI